MGLSTRNSQFSFQQRTENFSSKKSNKVLSEEEKAKIKENIDQFSNKNTVAEQFEMLNLTPEKGSLDLIKETAKYKKELKSQQEILEKMQVGMEEELKRLKEIDLHFSKEEKETPRTPNPATGKQSSNLDEKIKEQTEFETYEAFQERIKQLEIDITTGKDLLEKVETMESLAKYTVIMGSDVFLRFGKVG